ncbi:hypothetical protein Ancab_024601 [Ancistrocladus abbreviatus]
MLFLLCESFYPFEAGIGFLMLWLILLAKLSLLHFVFLSGDGRVARLGFTSSRLDPLWIAFSLGADLMLHNTIREFVLSIDPNDTNLHITRSLPPKILINRKNRKLE